MEARIDGHGTISSHHDCQGSQADDAHATTGWWYIASNFDVFPLHYLRCHERFLVFVDPLYHFRNVMFSQSDLAIKKKLTVDVDDDRLHEDDPNLVMTRKDVEEAANQLARELTKTAHCSKRPANSGLEGFKILRRSIDTSRADRPAIDITFFSSGVERNLLFLIDTAENIEFEDLLKHGMKVTTLAIPGIGTGAANIAANIFCRSNLEKDFRMLISPDTLVDKKGEVSKSDAENWSNSIPLCDQFPESGQRFHATSIGCSCHGCEYTITTRQKSKERHTFTNCQCYGWLDWPAWRGDAIKKPAAPDRDHRRAAAAFETGVDLPPDLD